MRLQHLGAPLRRARFECSERGSAHSAKPRVGRDVVQKKISPSSATMPTTTMEFASTATSIDASGRSIHAATFSGVLLSSQRAKNWGYQP